MWYSPLYQKTSFLERALRGGCVLFSFFSLRETHSKISFRNVGRCPSVLRNLPGGRCPAPTLPGDSPRGTGKEGRGEQKELREKNTSPPPSQKSWKTLRVYTQFFHSLFLSVFLVLLKKQKRKFRKRKKKWI